MSDLKHLPQNWVLISFDQWRGDWLHQKWLQLGCLRNLASQGWDVRKCYTSSPQCVPARASWLTGQSPGELGVTQNQLYQVPSNSPSFVRQLRDELNYRTVLVGKTHWTPHKEGVDLRDNLPLLKSLGFDHSREIAGPRALAVIDCELTDLWEKEGVLSAYRADLETRYRNGCVHTVRPTVLPDHLYPDMWLTGIAIQELLAMPVNRPWFLWVSFPGPHEPFDVPSSWRGKFCNGPIPDAEPRPLNSKELLEKAPLGSVLREKLSRWPEGIPSEALAQLRMDYADHLSLLDLQVSNLLDALSHRSDKDRTAITVCSDHGELLGDWGLLLKGCFLEGAIRSLFIHRPPRERNFLRKLRRVPNRPYGLTELLWAAARAVSVPSEGSFGSKLRTMSRDVMIEFASEKLYL